MNIWGRKPTVKKPKNQHILLDLTSLGIHEPDGFLWFVYK